MLQLVNYDLGGQGVHQALANAVATLSQSCHNPRGGPWLLKTGCSVEAVLNELDTQIGAVLTGVRPPPTRKLLALGLADDSDQKVLGAQRGLSATADWLAGPATFPLYDDGWYSPRVLALDFGLHKATSSDYSKLHMAIWHRFRGCCNPLHTLWFVRTSLPPEEVCHYLEPFLPNRDPEEPDGLLVFHARGPAVETGLDRVREDVGWLWENGITVKVR